VDSSVGGKVGINHRLGKNLIGAFYQPKMVVIDIAYLKTLPEEEFVCGMGEVVKYGILSDSDLFNRLESNLDTILNKDPVLLEQVIYDCVKIKADIVEADEKEQGVRAHLNLGHTFGHALETFFSYEGLKHGQAVLLGIKSALYVSRELNIIKRNVSERMIKLINKFDIKIPSTKKLDPEILVSIMKRDKKIRQGKINLVLPEGVGKITIKPVSDEKLLADSFSVLL
jgi:3-dehydroquinate synthase